ncbi:DUF4937 domain-containing protein [Peribacillus sp. YIM B13482]|uniref:DUF4937 domain-containing protein n=1 Tax=Peribacillus sp. YIM B13482 TaxID=3366298 RepID=UPI003671FD22
MKWIKCQVNVENKHAFSTAQEGWGELLHCAGFMGQIGGWNKNEPLEAGILSVWKDLHSYQRFMLFLKSDQRSTYTKISVDIFEKIFNIGTTDITAFFGKGILLRVTDCYVEKNKQAHFEQMQKEVWNKGMMYSHGILSGTFGKSKTGDIWSPHYGTMNIHINGTWIRNCLP